MEIVFTDEDGNRIEHIGGKFFVRSTDGDLYTYDKEEEIFVSTTGAEVWSVGSIDTDFFVALTK